MSTNLATPTVPELGTVSLTIDSGELEFDSEHEFFHIRQNVAVPDIDGERVAYSKRNAATLFLTREEARQWMSTLADYAYPQDAIEVECIDPQLLIAEQMDAES